MSDKEFGGSDDLSLPKGQCLTETRRRYTSLTTILATVQKIITEVLTSNVNSERFQGMAFAKETRDLLIECCVEFITMVSTEANDIAEKEAKKTIACEHVTSTLR